MILKAYKEDKEWFFDDASRDVKHEELVEGMPEIIEFFVGDAKEAYIHFDEKWFEGCLAAYLIDDNTSGGVVYELELEDDFMEAWLCKVFWKYFTKAPLELYVKIEPVK